jgi:hypothetical protein
MDCSAALDLGIEVTQTRARLVLSRLFAVLTYLTIAAANSDQIVNRTRWGEWLFLCAAARAQPNHRPVRAWCSPEIPWHPSGNEYILLLIAAYLGVMVLTIGLLALTYTLWGLRFASGMTGE